MKNTHSVLPKFSPRSCKVLFLGCMFSSTVSTRITRCSWTPPHTGNVGLQLRAAALTFRTNSRTRLHVCGVSLQPEKTSAASARTSYQNRRFTRQTSKKKCFIWMNQRKSHQKRNPSHWYLKNSSCTSLWWEWFPSPKGYPCEQGDIKKSHKKFTFALSRHAETPGQHQMLRHCPWICPTVEAHLQ